ncbi:MAG TPA: amidohydrolase [Cytophagaceae bacterium]|jgi:omega-amidase|nr:amidohydrolase [Cytophagaceae bacterium]
MQDLKISLIQSDLHWESPDANMAMFEEKIWKIREQTDIIILPEMFTTGFTMNARELAEPMNYKACKWMKQQAAQTKAVVTGSVIIKEDGKYFNRLLWFEPDGHFFYYDKRHLFRMADEHQTYSAGNKKLIREVKGWKIFPLVCYDLRFPVWSRNVNNAYDVLIYVANWPQARSSAWKALLKARAIENLSYCVGVNRVKEDGKGIPYSGDSMVINYKGEELFSCADEECIHTMILNYDELKAFREKFPADMDADKFEMS